MNNHHHDYSNDRGQFTNCNLSTVSSINAFAVRSVVLTILTGAAIFLGWSLVNGETWRSHESTSDVAASITRVVSIPTGVQQKQKRPASFWGSLPVVANSPPLRSADKFIQTLLSIDPTFAITKQQSQMVRLSLAELVAMGVPAIQVIKDLLVSGHDIPFSTETGEPFDFPTLRMALISALEQIGGIEAERLLLAQLNTDVTVTEMSAIADALDWLAPGLYTDSILNAAEQRLATISRMLEPAERTECGPLFQILQDYGSDDVSAILFQAPYWLQDYAQIALANLNQGQGIIGLSQRVERDLLRSVDSRGLHLLAQVAVDYPQAESILIGLVQADLVPEKFWPVIGDILMGDRQLQIEDPSQNPDSIGSLRGNNPYSIQTTVDRQVQTVYSVNYSAVLSTTEVSVRLSLISRLINETANPAAIRVLQSARSALEDYYWPYSY